MAVDEVALSYGIMRTLRISSFEVPSVPPLLLLHVGTQRGLDSAVRRENRDSVASMLAAYTYKRC